MSVVAITGTIIVFYVMTKLYARFSTPLLLPVLTTMIAVISILQLFEVTYESYMEGAKWINAMLSPAVVSMAYPLYVQRERIIKHKFTIMISIVVAMLSGLISIIVFASLLKIDNEIILSLLPKSITTPVAMQISDQVGGVPSLTAVFVILAGLTGALVGPIIFTICRIEKPVSRGVSMGSASHGIGVSKLSEYGEQVLSMGTVSMTLSAVVGSFLCPLFALFLQ